MKNETTQKRGSKKWLPLFFIIPIAFCLLFYVLYIRKPFTQIERPVFISLKHFGKYMGSSGGDSAFQSIPQINGTLSDGRNFTSRDNMLVIHFVPSLQRKICAMGAANLFRIQKRISHIKPLKMLSIPDSAGAQPLARRYKNETHAEGNKWDYLDMKDADRLILKNTLQQISRIPLDSLYTRLFLADTKGMIRGIYQAASVTEVNSLMNEIIVLNGEYKYKLYHHENSGK